MFPRTWSEELIAEWLELKGYFVETGAIVSTSSAGGRTEIDIIGTRTVNGVLEILHVEVGLVNQGAQKDLMAIRKKCSTQNQQAVINYVKRKIAFPGTISYSFRYIGEHVNQKSLVLIQNSGININKLEIVIQDEIIPDLKYWKHNAPSKPISITPTPPNNLWLIKLLDFIVVKVDKNALHY